MNTSAPRSIKKRLAAWMGGTGLVLLLIMLAVLVPLERRAATRIAADQVGLLAEAVAAAYQVIDETRRTHKAQEVLGRVARAPNVSFVDVLNHEGRISESSLPSHVGEKREAYAIRQVQLTPDLLVVTQPIVWTRSCVGCHDARDNPVGSVHVAVKRQAALAGLEFFHIALGVGVIVIFGILVLVLVVVAERLIGQRLHRLAKGDFLIRADVDGDDEVGALASAFNRMLEAITTMKVSEIEREQDLQLAQQELSIKSTLADKAEELTDLTEAQQRRIRAQELLMEAAHHLGETLNRKNLLRRLGVLLREKLGWPHFAVFLIEKTPDGEAILRVADTSGVADFPAMRNLTFGVGEGITGMVAETGAPHVVENLEEEDRIKLRAAEAPDEETLAFLDRGSMVSVPMLHHGRVVGVLDFFLPPGTEVLEEDITLVYALGAQAAMAVVNADLYETTLELAVSDPLTGLMNRRAMQRRMEIEIVGAQRFSAPLAVLMIDVDHFKKYNDRMGHLLGDEALKTVAHLLTDSVRKVDAVARFGGEEFCLILPRTDESAAREVADKLCEAVRNHKLQGAEGQPLGRLTISVGISVYPDDMPAVLSTTVVDALVDAADKALYTAKSAGRDRVMSIREVTGADKKPHVDAPRKSGIAEAVESVESVEAVDTGDRGDVDEHHKEAT
jgi:diguanylate cyclase (GGDEF)-like protein